ncbi:hypothetical protein AAG570_001037 [Ranatra chinensis]|uniref:Cadherin domain-containing protein n=1 Tax=Ranatra chinensis TaxID=642074 RepID=A0ABD0YT95_9HEMI
MLAAALPATANPRHNVAVLPNDIYPGYSIKKFHSSQGDHVKYRLLETGFSQFFTVLEDGLVMTTSDLSPIVNHPVNLVVLEESPNTTWTHTLHLYVLDRRDMLRFPKPLYDGARVLENAPVGTSVVGVTALGAKGEGAGGASVKYSISAGNDHGAFALKRYNASDAFRLVTARRLDREHRSQYRLTVQAVDGKGVDRATTKVIVDVLDVNDNSPVFTRPVYRFTIKGMPAEGNDTREVWRRFSKIGSVRAEDADGDKVAYRLTAPSRIAVIVPQTGELLLTGTPSRVSELPAKVWLRFDAADPDEETNRKGDHRISKRRVTRAVRPTKRIEFTEGDGETEGRIVFQLEKETERETFKIRDENPWVTVEPNGAVRVKKKWDYEELGPEKTIDFWVTITNAGVGGESYLF